MGLTVDFAANVSGQTTGATLAENATAAIGAAQALGGPGTVGVAAQFTFSGHTYLVAGLITPFNDIQDLLLDITGVTGTIATSNFI